MRENNPSCTIKPGATLIDSALNRPGGATWFQKMHAFNTSFIEAFAKSRGGVPEFHDIKVAILDTGIDAGHKAFETCISRRKSFIPDTHDFIDPDGHGTHVAGLVHQVAPNAKLLIGRIFDGSDYSQEQAAEVCIF